MDGRGKAKCVCAWCCLHYLQNKCTRNCFICKFCTDFELFSICSFRFENARDAQMNEWATPNTLSFCTRLRVLYICIDEIWSWMVFWWHYKISHFVQQWIADKSESRTVGCYYFFCPLVWVCIWVLFRVCCCLYCCAISRQYPEEYVQDVCIRYLH